MTNPNDTAYPAGTENHIEPGLTKLEYFSAFAMQGFISNAFAVESLTKAKTPSKEVYSLVAEASLNHAKALIEALNKEGK